MWEFIRHILQQCLELSHFSVIVNACYHYQHQFADGGGTYDEVAHHALVTAQVAEGVSVLQGIVAYSIAYLVGDIHLQPALLDGQYFVEGSCDVEPHDVALVLHLLRHLLAGEPALVAESEFQFVTVLLRLGGADNWTDFW